MHEPWCYSVLHTCIYPYTFILVSLTTWIQTNEGIVQSRDNFKTKVSSDREIIVCINSAFTGISIWLTSTWDEKITVNTEYNQPVLIHDDVIKWKHFPRYTGPLCGEFTGPRWIPLTKASDAELWCFLWSALGINGWINTRDAGDLRHDRAHCDVIVMINPKFTSQNKLEALRVRVRVRVVWDPG